MSWHHRRAESGASMRSVLTAVFAFSTVAFIPDSGLASQRLSALRVYGQADPPYGFTQFCQRLSEHCQANSLDSKRVPATPAALAELDFINRDVNRMVAPVTDREQFGVDEYWTLPTAGKGDCEEYVLEKRRRLMARAWPSGALLITVVLDENRQGHAILTARMSTGDLTLDNKHDDVRPWYSSPYTFIMRQSYRDPMIWVSLAPSEGDALAVAAGR